MATRVTGRGCPRTRRESVGSRCHRTPARSDPGWVAATPGELHPALSRASSAAAPATVWGPVNGACAERRAWPGSLDRDPGWRSGVRRTAIGCQDNEDARLRPSAILIRVAAIRSVCSKVLMVDPATVHPGHAGSRAYVRSISILTPREPGSPISVLIS